MSNHEDLDLTERAVHDAACPGMAAVRMLNLRRSIDRTRRDLKIANTTIAKTREDLSKVTSKLVDKQLELLEVTAKVERELSQCRKDFMKMKTDLEKTKAELRKFVASQSLPELDPFGESPSTESCFDESTAEDPSVEPGTKTEEGCHE